MRTVANRLWSGLKFQSSIPIPCCITLCLQFQILSGVKEKTIKSIELFRINEAFQNKALEKYYYY